jgi:hypothetical protein
MNVYQADNAAVFYASFEIHPTGTAAGTVSICAGGTSAGTAGTTGASTGSGVSMAGTD